MNREQLLIGGTYRVVSMQANRELVGTLRYVEWENELVFDTSLGSLRVPADAQVFFYQYGFGCKKCGTSTDIICTEPQWDGWCQACVLAAVTA